MSIRDRQKNQKSGRRNIKPNSAPSRLSSPDKLPEGFIPSQKFFEAMIDNIPHPTFIKDRKHRWVFANQTITSLIGHSPKKILGKSDYDFFPKKQADVFRKKDEEMFRTGKVMDIPEEPIPDRKGKLHYFHIQKAPLRDSSGKITHLVSLFEDIMERRQTVEELRTIKKQLEFILGATKTGVDIIDSQFNIRYIDPEWQKVYGDPAGIKCYKYFMGRNRVCPGCGIVTALKTKKPTVTEELLVKESNRPIQVTSIPFQNEKGEWMVAEANVDITERKRAEEALRESEEQLRLVTDSLPVLISYVDLERRYQFNNEAYQEWFEHPRTEVQGKHIKEVLGEAAYKSIETYVDKALSGKKVTFESTIPYKDGGFRHVSAVYIPHFGRQREVKGFFALVSDITKRKRTEDALKESENRYRNIIESAIDIIYTFSPDGIIISLNPSFETITGWRIKDWIGKSFTDLIHPEELSLAMKLIQESIAGKERPLNEFRLLKKTGDYVLLDFNAKPLLKDGKLIGFFGIARDITERKRAEGLLLESEEKYRLLVENANEAIVVAQDGWMKFVNPKMTEILGYSKEELLSQPFVDFIHPEDQKMVSERHVKRMKGEELPHVYHFRIIDKAGNVKWLEINAVLIDWEGHPATLNFLSDIHQRKQMEKWLIQKEHTARERALLLTDLHDLFEIDEILSRVCQTMRDSGLFERAVMTLHEPGGKINHLGQVGLPPDVVERARQAPPIDQKMRSRITSQRFRISDSFFIPVEAGLDFVKSGRYIPQKRQNYANGNWQAGDELFVPLRDFSGKIMGYLSVDTPCDGYRPDLTTIQALEMIVEAAAARVREVEANKAVQSSESKYRTLVETAQVGISIIDPEENIVFVNQAGADLLGYRKEELLSKKLRDICDDAQYATLKNELKKGRKGGSSKYEATFLTRSGKLKHAYVSSASLRTEDGSFMGSLTILSDLTEIKKAREYNVLLNTSRALSQTLKFDQVLRMGAEKMMETLKADKSAVLLTENHADELPTKVYVYDSKDGKVTISVINLKITKELLSTCQRTLRARGYVQISDARIDPMPELIKKILRPAKMNSSLIIPIILGKKMLAIFCVGAGKETITYGSEEIGLVQTMSNQVATALQNCRLMEDLERNHARIMEQTELLKTQYREQKMLFELAQALTSTANLDQLLNLACQKVTELLNTERSSIALVNSDEKSYTLRALYPRKGTEYDKVVGFTFAPDVNHELERVVTQQKPFITNDTSRLPKQGSARKYFLTRGIKSIMSVPLVSRGKVMGFITAGTIEKLHNYTTEELRLLQTVSTPIAVSIENYLLLEDLKEQAERVKAQFREQKMLFELTQALSYADDYNQLLKLATQKVTEILQTERSSVILVNPDGKSATLRTLHIKGEKTDPKLIGFSFTPDVFPQLKRLIQPGHFVVNDTSLLSTSHPLKRFFLNRGIKSTMVVPLICRGRFLGALTAATSEEFHHYTTEEVRLLQTISNPIATTIDNYLLLENLKEQAQKLMKQSKEKDILLQISQALSQTVEMDEVTTVAARVVGTTLGVDRCAVFLRSKDEKHVEVKGFHSAQKRDISRLIGTQYFIGNQPGWKNQISKNKFLVITDPARFFPTKELQEHCLREGIKSVFVAPMCFGKKMVGALSLSWVKQSKTFTPDESKLFQTIANQIAVALENARLMQVVKIHSQELKQLSSQLMKAHESERKKIAQELHDDVGQMLQSMKMNLDRIRRNLSGEPTRIEDTKDWLIDTEKLLSQTIDDIRTLTFDLRPSMLDDFGLISTLRWYMEDFTKRSNIQVVLKGKEEKYRFPLEIEINLYRIIQEALTNVAKHSKAAEVTIFLSQKDSTAILSVKDNGVGFDVATILSSPHKGMGVFNMKERVNLLGGSFEIISHPHKGTRVNVKIPFMVNHSR